MQNQPVCMRFSYGVAGKIEFGLRYLDSLAINVCAPASRITPIGLASRENLCRKLFSYGLGRSLLLSDESTVEAMEIRLAANEHRFGSLVKTIVTRPQFLRARGRDYTSDGTR